MIRPYIICHMVQSIDGKVTGDFLSLPRCKNAIEVYYQLNRDYKADAFACGRVTMEGSFTGGYYPDLSAYAPCTDRNDYIGYRRRDFFAVAFDRLGRLGWTESEIVDSDPGYGGAHIIEVLTAKADKRYLTYLRSIGVSYIFAGENEMDLAIALDKLKSLFGINTLLLEGGSILNGAFQREDYIDEISVVVAPIIADKEGKPLFFDSANMDFTLDSAQKIGDTLCLKYKKAKGE